MRTSPTLRIQLVSRLFSTADRLVATSLAGAFALFAAACTTTAPPLPLPPPPPSEQAKTDSLPLSCHYATALRFDGGEHLLWEGEENEEDTIVRSLTDQASIDLDCPREQITVAPVVNGFARQASGCGRLGAYTSVSRAGLTHETLAGRGPCTVLRTIRFLKLDQEPRTALSHLDDEYRGPRREHGASQRGDHFLDWADRVTRSTDLVAQAARDLSCPRDRILPGFWPGHGSVPVAEGCGERATYLPRTDGPLAIQSVVNVSAP